MCLGIPGKVISIEGEHAEIDYGGVIKRANISLVTPSIGEYVIVHAGFAIEKLDVKEAEASLEIWNQLITGREGEK